MPEEILQEGNPIYKYLKSKNLTDLDENQFVTKYSAPEKAKEIYSYLVSQNLTDLDETNFYDKYLKKKDQEVSPFVSSSAQSLSPDFEKGKAFAEKGFLMKPEGTKEQKRISVEPSLTSAIFGGAPKVKILEENEEPSTLSKVSTDLSSSILKGQIQGKVANILSAGKRPTDEELGEIAQLQLESQSYPQSQSEKLYQERGLKGLFKENPALGVQYVAETMASSLSSLFEASKRTVPTAVAMGAAAGAPIAGVGGLIGAGVGLLGGQSAAGYNLSTSQDILSSLSDNGVDVSDKESLIKAFSDENKMAKIRNTAAKYGVPIVAFDALTAGLAGKLAAGAMGKSLAKKLLAGLGETGIQIAGGSGGELAGQISSGKKVNWDEIALEGLAEVPGGISEVATGVAIERNKTASNNKTLATQIAYHGTENGVQDAVVNLNRDLANKVITPEQYQQGLNFVEKAAQVSDKVPENVVGDNRANSIELLVERNNIKEINQNLLQQKQTTDEAYHVGIDEEIKANEERLKKLDSEIYDISKKPTEEKVRPEIKITEEEITPEQEVTVTEEVKPTEDIYFNQLHRTEKFDDNASVSTYLGHNKNEKNIFYTLPNKGIISYDEVIPNTNRFTITANAKNDTPADIKNAFKRIEKYLPANHELLENKSISVDGLKVWDKFIKDKKYIKTGEINEVEITPIDKANIFKDLKYTTENKWSGAKFENKGGAEALARVEKYIKDNNLDFKVKLDGDVIKVEVPVLKYNPTKEVKPTEVKEEVNIVKLTDLPDRAFAVGMTVEKFEDLKSKIQKEGFTQPIIIDKESGNVLDGQSRLLAAQDLGIKDVPSIYMNNPTKADLNEKIKELEKQYIPSQEVKPTEEQLKTEENAVQEPSTREIFQRKQKGVGETRGKRKRVEPSIKGDEATKEGEQAKVNEEEKLNDKAQATLITQAANAETRKKLGLEQPELLSSLTDKERYEKAEKIIKKGYDINKLIDKMYNPEEVLNPIENAISNLYKQSLLSEIDKNPSDENLALAKRFLDARDQANSRAGAQLQSLKGEAPEVSVLDFYVNKMEDNNTDILTDKQKEEAKKEYEDIKAKLDIVEAKNKELEKLNIELLAQKAIDEQKTVKKAKTTETKLKRDYAAERKEIINEIRKKIKSNKLTAVPIPYIDKFFEISPDVAKLVKLYVEEGIDKLDDIVIKIHDILKDEIDGLTKKDIQDIIAGVYGKKSKAKTEIERKINDLKTEAKLINQIEDAKQLKPKTEKEKVEQNKKLTDLRKELNKVRKETSYYDESKLKSLIEKNKKETKVLEDKLDKGDFSEKEEKISFIENKALQEKYPELYKEYLDAVDKKNEQQHEYELKRAEEQMNALSKNEKLQAQASKFVKEGFSTVKSLKSGVDNSAVFVQSGIAVLNPMNYKATSKALVAQTQDLFSERRFRRRIVEVHENKPLWNLIETSGLDYLDPKGYNKSMREEQFGSSNWLEKKVNIGGKEIQISKYTTAPFERLFTSFSNEFRLQLFLRGAEQLAKEGKTIDSNPKEYKDLASYVNTITGRGQIHAGLKSSENAISTVIWAPKLLSSTLNLMGAGDLINLGKNKGYYRNMTPRMRKYAITQTAAGIGTGVALMAAYALLPDKEVDFDPESVTFGQVKDTETGWGYNIFGRLTPVIRYIAMMTTLTKKISEDKAQVVDPLKESYKFLRGKMAPTAGIFTDVLMRKDFSGKPYKLSNVPRDLFEPLFINDLRKQLEVDGTASLLTKGIPAFYGMKVSNEKMYDKRDLKSLLETVDSSTMDKNSLFNYTENRAVNNFEYKEFVKTRDSILKDYYKNISENGVPIINSEGKPEIVPIDSKKLTKDLFIKEINRLKGLATRTAKKELFGFLEYSDEQLDAKDELKDLRDEQGIGVPNEGNTDENF